MIRQINRQFDRQINRQFDRQINRQTDRQTDITNSISSLGKPSKNEIQQPNNYKKAFECVCKNLKIINNLMLGQAWTGGRPVSSICTDEPISKCRRQIERMSEKLFS